MSTNQSAGAYFREWTSGAPEFFSRDCTVSDSSGALAELKVRFFGPVKHPQDGDFMARANIACAFFERDVYAIGSDAAQAFFFLPMVTTAYLIGQRRYGYEAYWLEKGDLDYANFWTYTR